MLIAESPRSVICERESSKETQMQKPISKKSSSCSKSDINEDDQVSIEPSEATKMNIISEY